MKPHETSAVAASQSDSKSFSSSFYKHVFHLVTHKSMVGCIQVAWKLEVLSTTLHLMEQNVKEKLDIYSSWAVIKASQEIHVQVCLALSLHNSNPWILENTKNTGWFLTLFTKCSIPKGAVWACGWPLYAQVFVCVGLGPCRCCKPL